MLEIIGFIVTALAVWGVLLNNRRNNFCFKLWVISNLLSAVIHCFAGPATLIVRDVIFLFLAFEGMFLWKKGK